MALLVRSRRAHPEALDQPLPSLLAGGEKSQPWGSVSDSFATSLPDRPGAEKDTAPSGSRGQSQDE